MNPTLSVVTELVSRGVRVTYFTTEDFRSIIEPTGAKFVPIHSWMAQQEHGQDNGAKDDNVASTDQFDVNCVCDAITAVNSDVDVEAWKGQQIL